MKPKYQIGDPAYFLKDNKLVRDTITAVWLRKYNNEEDFLYSFDLGVERSFLQTMPRKAGKPFEWFEEDRLFSSTEALFNSLLKPTK